MDFALFTQIIDEGVQHGLCSIKLSYRGEPLVHPRIVDMVRYAKENGILDVYFNTNGMLLTEKRAQELIDAGLDRISISIEGTDPVAFESARIGAKFEHIRTNVMRLKELRDNQNASHPRIRCQTVALPGIDLQEYAEYWSQYCDETAVIDYKDAENEITDALVRHDWACPQPWQRMTIEWDGTMHPCNNDDQGKAVLGNAANLSVVTAWRSAIAETLRASHRQGCSHEVAACAACPWRQTQILKIMEGQESA
jgi:radical SAM protein with 4Fe4S-binding SPASM domain